MPTFTIRRLSSALLASVPALAMTSGSAGAAAIERTVPSTTRILFEDGAYGEIGAVWTNPHQRGHDATLPTPIGPLTVQGNTGDVFDPYWHFSGAWKNDINEQLSYVVLFDQPYGADTHYGVGSFDPAVFSYDGTLADLDTYQITGVLAYDVRPDVKLYAGLRANRVDADAAVPFVGPTAPPPLGPLPGYTVDTNADWGYGWLAGAAYSRPEIGLRVALSYHSKIDHTLETREFGGEVIPGLQDGPTETSISFPQSVLLEGQTGINEKTLVFGSARWVNWADFDIAPPSYTTVVGSPLVDYTEDWWTFNVGAARAFTDALAGSLSVTYEPSVGGRLTTLGPYDGLVAGTAALSYDYGQFNVTGGVTYGQLGDTSNVLDTDFDDGSLWGLGLRVGYTF